MENQKIFDRLNFIVQSIKPDSIITESTALIEDSVLDSLEFMNYLTKIEEAFSISISDSDVARLRLGITKNMIDFIKSKA